MSTEERSGDLQEYYANTGALKNAAETAQGGKKVGCSIVETFSKSTKPRELEEVLRLEYRSKLLNPKWAQVCVSWAQKDRRMISLPYASSALQACLPVVLTAQ